MNLFKRLAYGALLLGNGFVSAHAAQVTAVTPQTGRVEGQSVEVSAAVNWELPGLTIINPFTGPFFRVSAQAGGQTILLGFDSATGRYRGQFQGLLFNSHTITVTATKTTRTATIPIVTTNTSATRQATVFVGAQAGCFNFNQGNNLQSWTFAGFFNGDQSTNVFPTTPPLTWADPFGFLSIANDNNGGLVLDLRNVATPPSTLFPGGFWRFDFRSPDLSTRTEWQGIRGVSFRMAANPVTILDIQPLISARRPDGNTTFFRPMNGESQVFINFMSGELVYRVMSANISVPADHTIIGVHIRVFGAAGSQLPGTLLLDGVCPRR